MDERVIIIRILVAMLCGGIIGIERGRSNQAAGMRTYMLVSLGAAIVMMTGETLYQKFGTGDPARLGAQVISGIGFLGAGSIVISGKTKIRGLTTAAGLWVSACIGLSIGSGLLNVGVISTLAVAITMTFMKKVEDRLASKVSVYMEIELEYTVDEISKRMTLEGLPVEAIKMNEIEGKRQKLVFQLNNIRRYGHNRIEYLLSEIEGVKYVEVIA